MEKNRWFWAAAVLLILASGAAGFFLRPPEPAQAPAAQRSHPILASWGTGTGMMLGASRGEKWEAIRWDSLQNVKEGVIQHFPLATGPEQYKLYTQDRFLGEFSGGKPKLTNAAMPIVDVQLTPKLDPSQAFIGVAADWNPLPRVPARVQPDQAIRRAVREQLIYYGLSNAPLQIGRIWEIDLDGDSKVEQIIEASYLPDMLDIQPNTYSLLLLRRPAGPKAGITVLHKDFRGRKIAADTAPPLKFAVAAILDLNGDGRMEVIVSSTYYEGQMIEVLEIKDEKTEMVLTEGNGA